MLTGPAPGTQDLDQGLQRPAQRLLLWPILYLYPPFQNKCVPYWPEVGSQRVYGSYTVTNCGEHDTAEYKLRTLQVSPLDNVSVPTSAPSWALLGPVLLSGCWGWGDVWEQRSLTLCTWPRRTWCVRSGTTST